VAQDLAAEVAKNPPLSVRATVRTRRWYMDQLEHEKCRCERRR
jgi:enoyl-CoA hydratase